MIVLREVGGSLSSIKVAFAVLTNGHTQRPPIRALPRPANVSTSGIAANCNVGGVSSDAPRCLAAEIDKYPRPILFQFALARLRAPHVHAKTKAGTGAIFPFVKGRNVNPNHAAWMNGGRDRTAPTSV